jgi:hypothetical protein
MRADVAIPETEPRRFDTVSLQFFLCAEGLVMSSPSALRIDAVAEGVHNGVEVRTYAKSVDPDVVTGVSDDGNGGIYFRVHAAFIYVMTKSAKEPCAANTACENRDVHL